MTPTPKGTSLTDLLMEHALDPSVTVDQLQAELKASGVDINAILEKSRTLIGDHVRQHYAKLGTEQSLKSGIAEALDHFASWPIERIKHWLQELSIGHAGANAQALAQPCFRNKSPAEMSETEIRNLAAEIKATMDGGDGRKSF